jgi:small subunit ribosomal protein S8
MVDSISQLLISLKNANNTGKESVVLSYTKFRENILDVLKKEGFIKSVSKKGKKTAGSELAVELAYDESGAAKIQGVDQVSKPSKRIYQKSAELRTVKNGFGSLILTTPRGLMTGKTARREKVGGEVLFRIW